MPPTRKTGPSVPKPQPSKKQRRRACDICFKRKIQCDAEFPQCNWCKHQSLACTYNRLAASKDGGIYLPKDVTGHSIRSKRAYTQSFPSGHNSVNRAKSILSGMAYFNGAHMFSSREWIEARTGESINFENIYTMELPWANTSRIHDSSGTRSEFKLPSRSIVEGYARLWCTSFEGLVFPVISKWLFTETLDLAYGPGQVFGWGSARACIYSFLALVTLFELGDNLHGAMDCGSYALAAQNLMPKITQEMTPSGLEALVMLIQLQYFLGDFQAASISVSIAIRLLYKFEAHTSPDVSSLDHPHPYDKSILECHLRDLFWLCYSWDKDLCLRTGQPPSILDCSCDLSLPSNYAQMQDTNIQQPAIPIDDRTVPLYPFDLRLSMIKSEVYQSLYSASARRKSDTEILSTIRNLDQVLEQWRVSLHPDFRPTLWFTQEMRVNANLNTQAAMLRLAYHHCFTIIHQASERCTLSGYGHESQFEGISSSISLTIHASWSTLSYLQVAIPALKAHVFWVVIFYAITGVLTLFHNILKDPLRSDASTHVRILQDFPSLIRSIPISTLTLGEVIHMRFLDGFTAELARLGQCAILKAQQDQPVQHTQH
ncbi:hypothetical protein ASPCAL02474 [Aspergillus calidoustus]|uniref:Zn(2)-C6 fungal-type domain-containing protein n=1 Tax=Aspergillus calidoustus TaxID=454130 RepID=A0A0U5CMS7_ASPCI|nr:hypothetical protein ASPCAL02474 [Aspergillus calidoustus]